MNPGSPRYITGVTEVICLSRGRRHAVTTPGERTSSGIHTARRVHPHCTVVQVRKWVARACTGTGGGFCGAGFGTS
jgi:hypothetical protein